MKIFSLHCDCRDIEDAKKYSAPERKALKADVKKGLSSLISSSKARNIRDSKRPTLVSTIQFFKSFFLEIRNPFCSRLTVYRPGPLLRPRRT